MTAATTPSGLPLPVSARLCAVCGKSELLHRARDGVRAVVGTAHGFVLDETRTLPDAAVLAADAYLRTREEAAAAATGTPVDWSYAIDPAGWESDVRIYAASDCKSRESILREIAAWQAALEAFDGAMVGETKPCTLRGT